MLRQSPSQTVGPFFHYGLIFGGEHILTNDHTRGQVITITGYVYDGDGKPVPDALVEIWQADAQGIYGHPADPRSAQVDPNFRGFGRADTTRGGQFSFTTVKPGRVAWGDQQWQAPHINVRVFSRGLLTHAVTRLYFADERDNDHDPVLNTIPDAARRQTLLARPDKSNGLPVYHFDIVLQGEHETVFFQP